MDIELSTRLLPGSWERCVTIQQASGRPGGSGVKGPDDVLGRADQVGGRDAYHVTVSVPTSYINQQLTALGSTTGGATLDSASLDYWVYTDSLYPAKAEIKAASATIGSIDVTVTLTKYNEPVTITAPPASEIQAGT